jgi:putative DNA primase/helicase
VETGSGKRHYYLFCDEPFGPRQTFVKMSDNKWAIEFRAEGNYVIGPGSPTSTHKSGKPYRVIRGDIGEIFSCTPDEVATLIKTAKSFEKTTEPSAAEEFGVATSNDQSQIDLSRPGDDFDAHTDWAEILTEVIDPPFELVREDSDGTRCWKRPGGESEWSCKTGLISASGRDLMHVFSTGCQYFEPDQNYSKHAAYAAIAHDGDLKAAAAELRELGYGVQDGLVSQVESDLVIESTPLSQIKFRSVEWDWDQRIPSGYITNLTGDPGAGKGHLMTSIIAHVTTGQDWPDGAQCKQGDVIVISDEDGYDDVIGPRCQRHGADLDRVHCFRIRSRDGLDVHLNIAKHIGLLRQLVADHPKTRMMFFDPLSAYLGGIDSNSNSDVRGVLHSLGDLAKEYRVAIIGIGHFGKGEKRAVTRTLGSIAFTAKARVEWQAGIHPDDENEPDDQKRRLFLSAKNNLGSAPGLSYLIGGPRNASVLTWNSEPIYESASLLGRKPEKPKKIDQAVDLIESELESSPIKIADVRDKAKKLSISGETFRRAKRIVKPTAIEIDGEWHWTDQGGQPDEAN